MINFAASYRDIAAVPALGDWARRLPEKVDAIMSEKNGNLPRWLAAVANLPIIESSVCRFNLDTVTVGSTNGIADETRQTIEKSLRALHPWRKGPFRIHDIFIDTEWRSDWKWQRIAPHISPLKDRTVLDIGCGSGYHCWRMLGDQAKLVVGIDPFLLFVVQFWAIKHFVGAAPVHVLPLNIDDMPDNLQAFDTVFSMGVLYHRRSPIDHLVQLKNLLRPKGELALETLVIDGDVNSVLVPEDRYAKMRNVWFIPSCDALMLWMRRAGFTDIRLVDVNTTSTDEQRRTDWMHFESLPDYLNPGDKSKTIEGYPAPKRAIIVANAP